MVERTVRFHPRTYPLTRPNPPPDVRPTEPARTATAAHVLDRNSALGSALAACDKAAEGYEPTSLPGTKRDITLDQCYRGRDHLVCSFNAISAEANYLLQNYQNVTNANYPEIGSVNEICTKAPDRLASDSQSATEFTTRFKALECMYVGWANCAAR